jgi:hypothetical protein
MSDTGASCLNVSFLAICVPGTSALTSHPTCGIAALNGLTSFLAGLAGMLVLHGYCLAFRLEQWDREIVIRFIVFADVLRMSPGNKLISHSSASFEGVRYSFGLRTFTLCF